MKRYEEEDNIFDDETLPARFNEATGLQQSIEQNSKRLRILEWIAGGAAMITAGVVVERLAYRHAH